ncbi:MAG: uridine diphosphate-N-acetylglucosamine-binding protein YvcK [Candidatus Omnitrophica bacterium]|nr:uridine diphosphate-N-acetylglucosamine-binding protein YvcK [Candidatus Omnitrophota bacterium]
MQFFKWLYPGIGIKRWITLCLLGLGLIVFVALAAVRTISETSVLLASFATAVLIFGIFLVYTAIKNMLRIFVRALMPPHADENLVDIVYQKRQSDSLMRGPRVVVVGGGTGLSTLLAGVKLFTSNITAIVTVTDTGGSSGRLRDELDMLPPGDIRNCLVALADAEPLIRDLFQYRFEVGEGLKGHSFGNLFITALSKVTGDFEKAVAESSKVLAIRGRVIPSTLEKVTLVGEFVDGTTLEGETTITDAQKPLKNIRLKPHDCKAHPEALDAIANADLVILGPGSLYTSVLPNLLIKDLHDAILKTDAYKVHIVNVMTQPGETDGFSAWDHLRVLIEHTDPRVVDAVFVNVQEIPADLVDKYRVKGAEVVRLDLDTIHEKGYAIIEGKILKTDGQVRHDSEKLARLVFDHYMSVTKTAKV